MPAVTRVPTPAENQQAGDAIAHPGAGPDGLLGFAPWIAAAMAFAVLFWEPARMLVWDWWNEPDAGHGLLLAPLAAVLLWKR
ncbi:MAG TPA: archaeosortase/exosortase family protein, partial [Gemmatimonadaceae bacterium]